MICSRLPVTTEPNQSCRYSSLTILAPNDQCLCWWQIQAHSVFTFTLSNKWLQEKSISQLQPRLHLPPPFFVHSPSVNLSRKHTPNAILASIRMLNTHATCSPAHDQTLYFVFHPSTITVSLLYLGLLSFSFLFLFHSFPASSVHPLLFLPPHSKKKQHQIHVCFPSPVLIFVLFISPQRMFKFLTPRFLFVAFTHLCMQVFFIAPSLSSVFYPSSACVSIAHALDFFFTFWASSVNLVGGKP